MKNLIPVVLIILAILGFYYFVRPIYDRLPVLNREISQYKTAIKKAQELVSLAAELGQQYNAISGDNLARLDKIIPSNPDNMRLAADMSAIAARNGVVIKDFNFTEKKSTAAPELADIIDAPPQTPYKETTIDFSFSSSYQNFVGFLKDLENNLRIMDIKSISLASSDKNPNDYRISLTAYSAE